MEQFVSQKALKLSFETILQKNLMTFSTPVLVKIHLKDKTKIFLRQDQET